MARPDAKRNSPGGVAPDPSALRMYGAAYEEGKRAVDDQIAELDSMRQRTAQFLAFAGSATAFLVAAGLNPGSRSGGFYVLAIVATAISVATIALALSVLLTWVHTKSESGAHHFGPAQWNLRPSPSVLISDWIEPDLGASAEVDFFRDLAIQYDEMTGENEGMLHQVRRNYLWFLMAGSLQVIAWAAVVWAFA